MHKKANRCKDVKYINNLDVILQQTCVLLWWVFVLFFWKPIITIIVCIYICVKNVNLWVNYVDHLRKNLEAGKNISKIVFLVYSTKYTLVFIIRRKKSKD